jgi:hypothetical protein
VNDVNDADRLGRDPAMRWIVGGKAVERQAASTSQMGRFETELLATDENLVTLSNLPGVWTDKQHAERRHLFRTSLNVTKTTEIGIKRAAQTENPISSQGGGIGAFSKGRVWVQSARVSGLPGKNRIRFRP